MARREKLGEVENLICEALEKIDEANFNLGKMRTDPVEAAEILINYHNAREYMEIYQESVRELRK